MLTPLASRQTPSAPNPSQAPGSVQTTSSASARSARRFHAARIGVRLADARKTPQGARLAPPVGGGGLLSFSLPPLGRCAPEGFGRAVAACSQAPRRLGGCLQAAPSPRQPIGARLPRRHHPSPSLRRLVPAPGLPPFASLQTPSAPNPSQAPGSVQTTPFASARSARRFHAARIGELACLRLRGGCLPPHPRCCAVCVPLRAVLRPRGYPLRNVSPALPRLVTCLPPFPHPLPPFPPRTPRGGTTIGKVRFCRLSR